ncbi:MAG: delta-60 repeat domain-containing protein, partial [Acidimicrobiia bacterium]|nr:delta-60 repeat domain-containing protein [Acidimicrobiia bacterium]
MPSTFPLGNQPRVMDGRIYSIDTRGNSVMVGGTFTRIRPAATGSAEIAQRGIFKFDVSTGTIDPTFRPTLNGNVEGIRYSPDGASVYVAGSFTTVNGVTRNRVVKL